MESSVMDKTSGAHLPLTTLSEDEEMIRDMARDFAEQQIRPKVMDMDRAATFDLSLLPKCFEQGLMGIEIPEEYGGSGGSFFMAILAVEEFSRVDASAGVFIDVQNTLVNNILLRWASGEQKKKY